MPLHHLIPSSFGENVLKDFLSQYFNNIEISNDKAFLEFDIKITKVRKILDLNRPRYKVWFNLHVVKNEETIINKNYREEMHPPAIIESIYLFNPSEGAVVYADMVLHKEFFKILETKVKPDLIKALKENI